MRCGTELKGHMLFSVLQAVHDGKQVTDKSTRSCIIDAFHAMSLTENEPSAKDIQTGGLFELSLFINKN